MFGLLSEDHHDINLIIGKDLLLNEGAMPLLKVCGCYVVTFLNWTPRFDWYVVQYGSKNKHHTYTCLKEIRLCLQILITTLHLIMNTIGRTYVLN